MKLISNDTINTDFPVYSMYSIGTVNNETFTDRLKEANIEVSDRLQIGPTIGTHIGPEDLRKVRRKTRSIWKS